MKNAVWILVVAFVSVMAFGMGWIVSLATVQRKEIQESVATTPDEPVLRGPQITDAPPGPVRNQASSEFEVKLTRVEAAKSYSLKSSFMQGPSEVTAPCVVVYLEYRNRSEGRRYHSNGWPAGRLSDESGNNYRMLTDNHLLRPDKMPPILRPGESITDVLVFEAPIAQANMLRLYVQDHFSEDSGLARGAVEIGIPVEEVLDPDKVIR